MSSAPAPIGRPASDPRRVARIFDRRAAAFDAVSFLPREVAQRMGERLDYIKVNPSTVLDAGCGAGDDLPLLRTRFPDAPVFGVDLSGAMLARAGARETAQTSWRRFLPASLSKALGSRGPRVAQADFSALPFAADAFDCLWSNLALHWHARPDLVFPEWQRVLRVGGLLMFSTLGPDTLLELRAAYADAEAAVGGVHAPHVIDFVDMHDLGDMLVESGFDIPVMDQERLTVTYKSADSLLADVRRWGAYPFARSAPERGSRRLRAALHDALDARRRDDGTIPLTFELIYGHAWKAAPRTNAQGHAIVRVEDIGRGRPKNR